MSALRHESWEQQPLLVRQQELIHHDWNDLQDELRRTTSAEVRFDAGSRGMYAVDASNYRQVPIGVVVPRSLRDVIETVRACREFGAPLLSRGGGTSLAGQCCNTAIVLDWSKYLRNVVELNPEERYARVQPGIVLDDLRQRAEQHHLTFGPDPATHTHCTLGGMLGNNSCGVHAQMAGKVVDNTEELDILTCEGLRMTVGWMTEAEFEAEGNSIGRHGEIFRSMRSLRDRYANLIREKYPNIPRRVSGYNLDQLLPGPDGRFNLARALVGSEGTLVTILEAKLRLVPSPPARVLLVLGYRDIYEAGDHVPALLEFQPIGFEAIDHVLITNMKEKHLHTEFLPLLPDGKGFLVLEFGAVTREAAEEKARQAEAAIRERHLSESSRLFTNPEHQEHVWKIRESGLGATAFVPGHPPNWPGWEDSAVAPDKVGPYLRDLRQLYDKYHLEGALYGHFGMGCIHSRISFDLFSAHGVERFRSFIAEASDLVVRYGGSLSGEHGDGQSRAEMLEKMFGPELVRAFGEFKAIWDPQGRMNPGKIVDPFRIDQNLRLGADYHPWEPLTHFQWPDDHGSFAHAALRCVGVGKCRREAGAGDEDTMCPSYMVTFEEKHTTRGRAHALWEMLHGDVIQNGWRDENVKESLDLCLSCKGCKGDCPVNVDMATYKAEFLSHYWEGRLRPRYAYAYGLVDQWARLASVWPGLVNLVTQTPGLRAVAKLAAGMPLQRSIPEFAPYTFQSWFRHRNGAAPRSAPRGRVILWPDTFNNYFFPETAQAAVEVLEQAGFQTVVPSQHVCCGRPLYDYGMLDRAEQYLLATLDAFEPEIRAGTPFVFLEPSCASVFRDELKGLLPHDGRGQKLTQQSFLLSELLDQHADGYQPPRLSHHALVQGHCHHKALMKTDAERSLLKKTGLDFQMLNSGCCGMAGSFGFEAGKYDVSIAIGERVLLPAVREAGRDTLLIANGFSCREQIAQQTSRQALHLAEVLHLAAHPERVGRDGVAVERPIVRERQKIRRRARWTAAALLGATAAGLTLATRAWSRR